MPDNKSWADAIIKKYSPGFKHRWEAYKIKLRENLDSQTVWIDCGCGDNGIVEEFGSLANYAVGCDLIENTSSRAPFLKADISKLPFEDESADLVTLRFVVEHISDIDSGFSDIIRVLKKGGRVIVLTTNLYCPFIFAARFVPFRLKNYVLSRLFRVEPDDVFKTYHKLNSPAAFQKGIGRLRLKEIEYISDLNYQRKPVFLLFFLWHMITRPGILNKFRTNILATFEKIDGR